MRENRRKSTNNIRLEIAQIAAKYIARDGINDFQTAKRKAALQVGMPPDDKHMPTNIEVEQAIIDYQNLFQYESHKKNLFQLRSHAVNAMYLLERFAPKLVGPVLTGTATQHSEITLHLFIDEVELIGFALDNNAIPFTRCKKNIKVNKKEFREFPAYRFIADDTAIILVVFPENFVHQPPLSTIDDKPMNRMNVSNVEQLISKSLD